MIYRVDVRTVGLARDADEVASDPVGESIRHQIAEFKTSIGPIRTRRIFLIDSPADAEQVRRASRELLADPIVEEAEIVEQTSVREEGSRIEIHLKPGVMDPVAASTVMALRDLGMPVNEVRTGRAYLFSQSLPQAELGEIASRVLANGVIESVHFERYLPDKFPAARECPFKLVYAAIRELADSELAKFSRDAHLFLSLEEMKAIQSYYRKQNREPTDIELETIAQTWSEHCVHKTLKSPVDVEVSNASGAVVERRHYDNLIKETIFKSTVELDKRGFCLSVFKDNAGVIAFDDTHAVCFKVETHNHPSALEPYGGSATGVGGVVRDVLGTGLGAKPIANTDVFCVAFPNGTTSTALPKGVLHPKRVLQQVVAGVRDYGNRMGIPTVNGAVYFDDRYLANPLVFCGCAGLIPRNKIEKETRPGDVIVLMGGRTGRDGIHGATFSSAELTDTHADEFSHAVQIGNAITEKKVGDIVIQARERGLFNAITDCGAGGLSSAVGEMGEKTGAMVMLDQVPLKYTGLKYDEIWISEAQERMVLAVPPMRVDELLALAGSEDVEATVIGEFGTANQELILKFGKDEVGRLSMDFLHHGLPMSTRKAVVIRSREASEAASSISNHKSKIKNPADLKARLLAALAHPNIASKHWLIRQYDHEVQGGSVIKPLTGPLQIGPSDAAVLRPKLNSMKGIALSCGMAPHIQDPYRMAIASIDEAIRNAVCVGADLSQMAILDNFCWPSVADEMAMGSLVAACEACRDAALAYEIPFISGKDSLNNQFTNQETGEVLRIPNTLLISGISVIEDVRKCVTMDLKQRTSRVILVSAIDESDLKTLAAMHRLVSEAIRSGAVRSAHDVSDGGLAVAAAEMAIASGLGLIVSADLFMNDQVFVERPGRYLLEIPADQLDLFKGRFASAATVFEVGLVQHLTKLAVTTHKERVLEISLDELTSAWRGTLDW
jgi:phosphoribosylformylglycinamidine synthase II